MTFEQRNKYTLYIKPDNNLSHDIINHYIQLEDTCTQSEDSGIDLYVPQGFPLNTAIATVDHMVSCCMCHKDTDMTTGYYLYPRSSIYKYPVMAANSVGIIDSGYRGNIKGMLRTFNMDNNALNVIPANIRLFQICAPDLSPLKVKVLRPGENLPTSLRGTNGFGSTGN